MIPLPSGTGPAPTAAPTPVFPPRRSTDSFTNPLDAYLAALERSLAGQIDPALEANGIITPLGAVARAALVEAIGADLEAAVRDLMLTGVPRERAEREAISSLGPAPLLGRDLLVTRRREAVEAWQSHGASLRWWVEAFTPVAVAMAAVFLGAVAPTMAVIAGMAAEPHMGAMAMALVPLCLGLLVWVAGTIAPTSSDPTGRN